MNKPTPDKGMEQKVETVKDTPGEIEALKAQLAERDKRIAEQAKGVSLLQSDLKAKESEVEKLKQPGIVEQKVREEIPNFDELAPEIKTALLQSKKATHLIEEERSKQEIRERRQQEKLEIERMSNDFPEIKNNMEAFIAFKDKHSGTSLDVLVPAFSSKFEKKEQVQTDKIFEGNKPTPASQPNVQVVKDEPDYVKSTKEYLASSKKDSWKDFIK